MDMFHRIMRMVCLFTLLLLVATASAATGTIQINVHPGGGTVCLDTVCKETRGIASGDAVIVTFDGVEAGSYHMLSVYGTSGHEPYLGQVYLDLSGKALTREIYLDPLPTEAVETGTLRIDITPDGGKACLDRMCEVSSGDRSGSWSVQFTDVTAGTNHTLIIANTGFETYTSQVRLVSGKTTTMTVVLEPLPPGQNPGIIPPTPPMHRQTQPTPASLPTWVVLLAFGICGILFFRHRS